MYMGAVASPEARTAASLGLPVGYAKHSCTFAGMVVVVLSAFPFKTVIKKKKNHYSSIVSSLEGLSSLSF